MTIEDVRASLKNDALIAFDNALSKCKIVDNVEHKIIDFTDANNFVLKAMFNTKPHNGFVIFEDGNIAGTYCC